jgi:hypothetical protein
MAERLKEAADRQDDERMWAETTEQANQGRLAKLAVLNRCERLIKDRRASN